MLQDRVAARHFTPDTNLLKSILHRKYHFFESHIFACKPYAILQWKWFFFPARIIQQLKKETIFVQENIMSQNVSSTNDALRRKTGFSLIAQKRTSSLISVGSRTKRG
jgi:hypothetical protein